MKTKIILSLFLLSMFILVSILYGTRCFYALFLSMECDSDEHVAEIYSSGSNKIVKCLREGNATVGFHHTFYWNVQALENLILVVKAREGVEPRCVWTDRWHVLIFPVKPEDVVSLVREQDRLQCSLANGGVEIRLGAEDSMCETGRNMRGGHK